MPRRQGIFWLLTIPFREEGNCGDAIAGGSLPPGVCWAKGQKEKGEDTGYVHWQLVVALCNKGSLGAVKRILGCSELHGELSRSEAANAYVCKEDTRVGEPFEWGAQPFRRNSKVDWERVWELAKLGDLNAIPANVRVGSYRTLRAIASDFSVPVRMERVCFVYWGSTGTGKSRRAWEEAGDCAYSKCPRSKFWDGYQDQSTVVIDEFRGGN